MIRHKNIVRRFTLGGLISISEVLKITATAEEMGARFLQLGSRQDILFSIKDFKDVNGNIVTLKHIQTSKPRQGESHNIQSSFITHSIIESTTEWLTEDVYRSVLTSFPLHPSVKINVTDPKQTLVPLFAGHLNFVASEIPNYWFFFIRKMNEYDALWSCPNLIHSHQLSKITKYIESNELIESVTDWDSEWEHISKSLGLRQQYDATQFEYHNKPFSCYEGFHKVDSNNYWLGLYWRDNKISISFLKALCALCLNNQIDELRISPWKSLIINGISEVHLKIWDKLLGKFGINIRHSALELNWHLPVMDESALALKNYIVRCLHKQDISTHGLSFSIKSNERFTFTPVVIERTFTNSNWEHDSYNILYAHNYDPSTLTYHPFVKEVSKEVIPPLLSEISENYYLQLEGQESAGTDKYKTVYQCTNCFEYYQEHQLQVESMLLMSFQELPKEFCCTNCGAGKKSFIEMIEEVK
ncbi:rubredoxin [Sediminitomix flava]|uniref:Rubredoxin n=1 Tax=Sediminitomix flava TaxID=379075 RepID=A0A316A550_SEDFL|nr:rubredoxin [Sediminitomix flava]PWJ44887.1 hypothetical protein BC781_1011276 [Sediminitomix flava]